MKYSRNGSTRSLKALWGEETPYSRSLSQISPIKASILAERLVSAMRRSTSSLSWSWAAMEVLLRLGQVGPETPPESPSVYQNTERFARFGLAPARRSGDTNPRRAPRAASLTRESAPLRMRLRDREPRSPAAAR